MSSSLGQSSGEGGRAERVRRRVASWNSSGGTCERAFHGVSVKNSWWKVIWMCGWLRRMRSKIAVGGSKGRITRRCSGLGPPPIVVEDSGRDRVVLLT